MSENRGTLPQGWEWKKLGDIGKISTGKTPPKINKEFYINGTIHFVKPPNLQNKQHVFKTQSDEYVTDEGAKKSTILPKNTLMVCCIGSLGKFALSTERVITNQQINSIMFDEKIMDYRYGYYYAFNFEKLLNEVANEAVVKIVNKSIFSNILIPFPPLEEQRRIVGVLDGLFGKIDKSIALLDASIASASSLMPSALNEVFEELEGKYLKELLGNVDTKMSAGGTPLRSKSEFWNGDIPWFSSGELNQKYTLSSKEYITPLGLKNSSAKLFEKGTLLVGMYDTAAMKMSILHTDGASNQAIVGVKPKENELNIFFLMYQLEYLKPKILEERQGVRQQNLNLSKLKNIQIEYPPLDIQTQTVAYLDALQLKAKALKKAQEKKKEELLALKASLLESAFKGAL